MLPLDYNGDELKASREPRPRDRRSTCEQPARRANNAIRVKDSGGTGAVIFAGASVPDCRGKVVKSVKITTYNVNGVNGRLPRLLNWLAETSPDVVCLQELKTDDSKFPIRAIESAGYGAVWHGQRSHHGIAILAKGETPVELRRGLPGNSADIQTRYLEAQTKGIVVASI